MMQVVQLLQINDDFVAIGASLCALLRSSKTKEIYLNKKYILFIFLSTDNDVLPDLS